jgi:hypothetical protein
MLADGDRESIDAGITDSGPRKPVRFISFTNVLLHCFSPEL